MSESGQRLRIGFGRRTVVNLTIPALSTTFFCTLSSVVFYLFVPLVLSVCYLSLPRRAYAGISIFFVLLRACLQQLSVPASTYVGLPLRQQVSGLILWLLYLYVSFDYVPFRKCLVSCFYPCIVLVHNFRSGFCCLRVLSILIGKSLGLPITRYVSTFFVSGVFVEK